MPIQLQLIPYLVHTDITEITYKMIVNHISGLSTPNVFSNAYCYVFKNMYTVYANINL